VEAAAVYKHGTQSRPGGSFLGNGRMEVFNAELWVVGLALDVMID
jgi:hypothetical protein